MIYEKEKIKDLIEYKDNIEDEKIRQYIEWLISCYNDYFIESKEYEKEKKNYRNILHKYYTSEDEKENLNNRFIILKNKYLKLKQLYNDSCGNTKNMV